MHLLLQLVTDDWVTDNIFKQLAQYLPTKWATSHCSYVIVLNFMVSLSQTHEF